MTIEQLEKMAQDLYRESADRLPETIGNDKDNWMAGQIEGAIQQKGPLLQKLLKATGRLEVYKLLTRGYDDTTYEDAYDQIDEDGNGEYDYGY